MIDSLQKKIEIFTKFFCLKNRWENVLYVHTPFCLQKCRYCVYGSKTIRDEKEKDDFYQKLLPQQISQYNEIFKQTEFDHVHFGGGTPTIADAKVLQDIFNLIPNFSGIDLKTIEVSPYTLNDDHINIFRQNGFKYVSMGVQTFSEEILKKENRLYVDKEKLIHLNRKLEEINIINNIDLIFHLHQDTNIAINTLISDLEYLFTVVKPASITIHYNYLVERKQNVRLKLIQILNDIKRNSEFICVNSLLNEADDKIDTQHSAEYRLMRKSFDFNFYMLPKFPQSHTFSRNMLSLGEYETIKPRANYFYIYDYMDKYAYRQYMEKLKFIAINFNSIRKELGLSQQLFVEEKDFFNSEKDYGSFLQLIRKYNIPNIFNS